MCQMFPLLLERVLEEIHSPSVHDAVVEPLLLSPRWELHSGVSYLIVGPGAGTSTRALSRIGTCSKQIGRIRRGEITWGKKCAELKNTTTKNPKDRSKEVKWRGQLGTWFHSLILTWPSNLVRPRFSPCIPLPICRRLHTCWTVRTCN